LNTFTFLNFIQQGGIISSQQLFNECIHEENLDKKLKAELKDLAKDSRN